MTLAEQLGERKIIEIILKHVNRMPKMPVPFGDDVSALNIGDGKLAVMKTDMLVGKTDVPPTMNLWQAARKAVIMNISDLAAKGVKPAAILAAIGIPRYFAKKHIEQIGKGLNAGAREYSTYILGGDTNEASDLVISCSAFGITKEQHLMRRSGAQPGDIVAVTGLFGNSACGLRILLEKRSVRPDLKEAFINAVLMPHARLKEGLALAETEAVTASIDSSDGLAWSLHEMSKASKTGILIDNLPIAPEAGEFAKMHGLQSEKLVLYGGEEYELVVTVNPDFWTRAEKAVENTEGSLVKIGVTTRDKRIVYKTNGKTMPIKPKGWEHFR